VSVKPPQDPAHLRTLLFVILTADAPWGVN
jgi:hypothetical protein